MDIGHLDNSHCPSACSDCQFLETPSSRPWCKLLRHSHMGSSLLCPMILSMYSLLDLLMLIYHQKYLHLKTIVLKPCLNHVFFNLKSVSNLHIVGLYRASSTNAFVRKLSNATKSKFALCRKHCRDMWYHFEHSCQCVRCDLFYGHDSILNMNNSWQCLHDMFYGKRWKNSNIHPIHVAKADPIHLLLDKQLRLAFDSSNPIIKF